jgi:hypothetical protein
MLLIAGLVEFHIKGHAPLIGDEKGLRIAPGPFTGKSYLTNVLCSSNISEAKDLMLKVQKLKEEKVHRESPSYLIRSLTKSTT